MIWRTRYQKTQEITRKNTCRKPELQMDIRSLPWGRSGCSFRLFRAHTEKKNTSGWKCSLFHMGHTRGSDFHRRVVVPFMSFGIILFSILRIGGVILNLIVRIAGIRIEFGILLRLRLRHKCGAGLRIVA